MITFDHPNYTGGFECPICKTGANAPVTLIPIPGTEREGIMEAIQVHVECWELAKRMAALESDQ
jgi:hypothetical protein